jgi:translation initiation factor IF-3
LPAKKTKRKSQQLRYRINEQIRARELRVVGDNIPGGNQIMSLDEALSLANELEMDLVEINPNANPPVAKIIDYNKFLYEQKKKLKEQAKKSAKVEIKELRFTPNTSDHDMEFKINHARKFLEEGNKVKGMVFYKGRSILFKDRGQEILQKFIDALSDISEVEQQPKFEGRRLIVLLKPTKKHPKKQNKPSNNAED